MLVIVLTVLVVLGLFVVLGVTKDGTRLCWKMRPRQLLSLLGCLVLLTGMFATVPTGHTGILTTFGRVEDVTLEAGLHIKSPVQEVVVMDNRTQKSVVELSCFSSDIQEGRCAIPLTTRSRNRMHKRCIKISARTTMTSSWRPASRLLCEA